jgi:hypothetical protein
MRIVSIAAVLLAVTGVAQTQRDTSQRRDAMPEVVVQRFVDAGNARNAAAMAALVALDAVFAQFPSGQIIAQNRDGIREH